MERSEPPPPCAPSCADPFWVKDWWRRQRDTILCVCWPIWDLSCILWETVCASLKRLLGRYLGLLTSSKIVSMRAGCGIWWCRLRQGCWIWLCRLGAGCGIWLCRLRPGCGIWLCRLRAGCGIWLCRLRPGCGIWLCRLRAGCGIWLCRGWGQDVGSDCVSWGQDVGSDCVGSWSLLIFLLFYVLTW